MFVGPFFSGKFYLAMKKLEMSVHKEMLMVARSPEQYSEYNLEEKSREISE